MSETQTVEPTVVTPKPPSEAPAVVEAKEPAPAAEVKPRIEALREMGVKVADTGLTWGRFALERSARALDSAAGQLGHWQEKLRGGEGAPAEQASQAAA